MSPVEQLSSQEYLWDVRHNPMDFCIYFLSECSDNIMKQVLQLAPFHKAENGGG